MNHSHHSKRLARISYYAKTSGEQADKQEAERLKAEEAASVKEEKASEENKKRRKKGYERD